jgi:2-oxoglutarate/2-oxoacid ferredoxin oxidoreductase subunit beta
MRRNIDIKVLMFNNRIYGLTKGQYSPTSEQHKRTKSSPFGSLERPFEPISLALGAGATFVARSVDVFGPHLKEVLRRAAAHKGSAFIEILQNCNIFNDGAWDTWTDREAREGRILYLEHDQPLVFGKDRKYGIARIASELKVVERGADHAEGDLARHDERRENASLAFELAQFGTHPENPMPVGVFRSVEIPAFDTLVHEQMREVRERMGKGSLDALIGSGETWEVG